MSKDDYIKCQIPEKSALLFSQKVQVTLCPDLLMKRKSFSIGNTGISQDRISELVHPFKSRVSYLGEFYTSGLKLSSLKTRCLKPSKPLYQLINILLEKKFSSCKPITIGFPSEILLHPRVGKLRNLCIWDVQMEDEKPIDKCLGVRIVWFVIHTFQCKWDH